MFTTLSSLVEGQYKHVKTQTNHALHVTCQEERKLPLTFTGNIFFSLNGAPEDAIGTKALEEQSPLSSSSPIPVLLHGQHGQLGCFILFF